MGIHLAKLFDQEEAAGTTTNYFMVQMIHKFNSYFMGFLAPVLGSLPRAGAIY